ncbi:MAG: hypothetical protein ACN0LA_11030 [Candidatus Longimicrobiales bacterium M2_2A_002]
MPILYADLKRVARGRLAREAVRPRSGAADGERARRVMSRAPLPWPAR